MADPAKKVAEKPSGKKDAKKKDALAFDFNFDAHSKPITEKMLTLEAKRQKSFFSKKTKFPIADIIPLLDKKTSPQELINPLLECALFYKKMRKKGLIF